MKFGVVVFPGSNCDRDMEDAIRNDLGKEVIMLWHKDMDLSMFTTDDCIILPGGFSYGDYLRCGAIARFSPMMQSVIEFANKGGKVLGVCNGFQILAEAGLVPGALLHNKSRKFICNNIYLKSQTSNSLLTCQIELERPLKIPIAHGEGNFFTDPDTLYDMNANDQVLFRYCDIEGNISPTANPNGSLDNIAGVCNKNRNVFGMMPHPERAADAICANEDGLAIFESILSFVKA